MRARTTLILLALAAAVGAYIWLVERFDQSTSEREMSAHLVLTVDQTKVDTITIKRANDSIVLVQRADGHWHLTAPLEDRADEGAVTSILKLASEFEITRKIPGEEIASGEVKVVDLGLDATNAIQVTFASGDTTLGTTMIGNPAPWDDTVYCRVLDDSEREDVYVAATGARPILTQPAEAFRDTYLTRYELSDIVGVSIQQGTATEIELQRADASPDAAWLLTKPLSTQADSDLINKMLGRLLNTRVETFLTDENDVKPGPGSDAVVVTLRTISGVTTVTLEPPSGTGSQLAVSRTSDRKGSFLVDDEVRKVFAARDETTPLWQELRSRLLGRINPAKLTTIIVRRRNQTDIPVWLYGQSWYMTRDSQFAETADKKSLLNFVEGLNSTVIIDFANDTGEDLEKFGLADPAYRIDFSSVQHRAKGSPTATSPENTTSLLIGQGDNGRIYSKYAHEPFVYQVGAPILQLLPHEPIKWKDRNLLNFNQSAVQGIIISRKEAPPVEFTYDTAAAEWTAKRSGENVTSLINKQALERLRGRLSVFYADDWCVDFTPLENLKSYTLEIRLIGKTYDGDETKAVTRVLRFVSTDPKAPDRRTEFYYGSLDGVSEPFRIRQETYEALYDPILRQESEEKNANPAK
ncbi:MAG: DUF4340 domain-containing protein [Verrucomicrobiae bacterium]|nr:DUF4340 domain-containing protein [Verrucomicrobiae bacterium]